MVAFLVLQLLLTTLGIYISKGDMPGMLKGQLQSSIYIKLCLVLQTPLDGLDSKNAYNKYVVSI